jgi:hypothetical protein
VKAPNEMKTQELLDYLNNTCNDAPNIANIPYVSEYYRRMQEKANLRREQSKLRKLKKRNNEKK